MATTVPIGSHLLPHFPPSHPRIPRNNDVDDLHLLFQRRMQLDNKNMLRVVMLTGPSGIGKTWLAMQYVERYGKDFRFILWGDALSSWHLADSFIKFAPELGLSHVLHETPMEVVHHVVHHLNTVTDWLLVLDGCWGDLRELTTFLPTFHGCVLATALHFACGCGADETEYTVLPFTAERVMQFISDAMSPTGDHQVNGDSSAMTALAERCEGLPQRMALCAAVVSHAQPCPKSLLEQWISLTPTAIQKATHAGPLTEPPKPRLRAVPSEVDLSEMSAHERRLYLQQLEEDRLAEERRQAELERFNKEYGPEEEEESHKDIRLQGGSPDLLLEGLICLSLEVLRQYSTSSDIIPALTHALAAATVADKWLLQQWMRYYRQQRKNPQKPWQHELEDALTGLVRHRIVTTVGTQYQMHHGVAQAILAARSTTDGMALGLLVKRMAHATRSAAMQSDGIPLLLWHGALAACAARNFVKLRATKLLIMAANQYARDTIALNAPVTDKLLIAERQVRIALQLLNRVLQNDTMIWPYPHQAANEALTQYHLAEQRVAEVADELKVGGRDRGIGHMDGLDLIDLGKQEVEFAHSAKKQFINAIRTCDMPLVVEMLKQSRLLAYLGHVDWDEISGTALCANPFTCDVLPLMYPTLTYQEHLGLWMDLTDAEIAKLHGNDWEKTKRPIFLPLLEAVKTGQSPLVELLVNSGVYVYCCSPHDMLTPLQLAVQCESMAVIRALLPHCDVLFSPKYVLSASRDALFQTGVCRVPWTGPSALEMAMSNAAILQEIVLYGSLPPAAFEARITSIMTTLQYNGGNVFQRIFSEGSLYHDSAPKALQVLLDLFSEQAAHELLPCLSPYQCKMLLFNTSALNMMAFLLRLGPDSDLNSTMDGLPLVMHHIAHGHLDIVMFLLSKGCDVMTVAAGYTSLTDFARDRGQLAIDQAMRLFMDAADQREQRTRVAQYLAHF